jgi:hypothetical protein
MATKQIVLRNIVKGKKITHIVVVEETREAATNHVGGRYLVTTRELARVRREPKGDGLEEVASTRSRAHTIMRACRKAVEGQ